MQPLGDQYEQRTQSYVQQLTAGQHQMFGLSLTVEDHVRVKTLHWRLTGKTGKVWADVSSVGRIPAKAQGNSSFGMDSTSEFSDPMRIRFTVETENGSLVRTPIFTLPLSKSSTMEWTNAAAL